MKFQKFCLKITLVCMISLFAACPGLAAASQADTQPPSPPADIRVVNKTHTTVELQWSASSDNVKVQGYYLFRDGKKIITTSKNSFTSKYLIPGQKYTYTVKAYDASGNVSESSPSITVFTVADSEPPKAPGTPYALSVEHTSLTLNWEPSSDNVDLKNYEIYVNGARKGSTTKTTYTCKSLSPGNNYAVSIKAVDLAGNSAVSKTAYISTLKDTQAPSRPSGLEASSVTQTQITLKWSAASDNVKVKKYEVYCDGNLVGSPANTTFTCKKLNPGTRYSFTVKAIDTSGLFSAASAPLTVSTLKDTEAPAAPSSLIIKSAKGSSVSLDWEASKDNVKVKGYNVYCNNILVATTTKTSITVKNNSFLGLGIYWVRAFDTSGNLSEKSNTVVALSVK